MVEMSSTSAAEPSLAMNESPNRLKMPDELMANILHRLGTVEILKSARKVCTNWWRICNDPATWKVIHIHSPRYNSHTNYNFEILTKQAVDLSCGELIEIVIDGFGSDDLLDYVVLRSSKLKSLSLMNLGVMFNSGLRCGVERLPQLEKRHLYRCHPDAKVIEVIGRNCPQLKSFKVSKVCAFSSINCDNYAHAIANDMPELRHLELNDGEMTNDGLKAILNDCPHLQSLDVRGCCSLYLGGKLGFRKTLHGTCQRF